MRVVFGSEQDLSSLGNPAGRAVVTCDTCGGSFSLEADGSLARWDWHVEQSRDYLRDTYRYVKGGLAFVGRAVLIRYTHAWGPVGEIRARILGIEAEANPCGPAQISLALDRSVPVVVKTVPAVLGHVELSTRFPIQLAALSKWGSESSLEYPLSVMGDQIEGVQRYLSVLPCSMEAE